MKKTFLGLLPIIVAMLSSHISAQTADSIDVLNYRIYLDVNHNVSQTFVGHTDVSTSFKSWSSIPNLVSGLSLPNLSIASL